MSQHSKGFGLVEVMLALVLGALMSLAITQLFIGVKNTYMSQASSAMQQQEASFILSKLVQEVRMSGMFGCLATVEDQSVSKSFTVAAKAPVHWDANRQSLTLITAVAELERGEPEWTIHSDCETFSTAYSQGRVGSPFVDALTFPVHKQIYRFNKREQELLLNNQPLLSNVSSFSVMFGVAPDPPGEGIKRYTTQPDHVESVRSVRITLTLLDPSNRTPEQAFSMVGALRNRLE